MREFDVSDTIVTVAEHSKPFTTSFFLQRQAIQDTYTAICEPNSYELTKRD